MGIEIRITIDYYNQKGAQMDRGIFVDQFKTKWVSGTSSNNSTAFDCHRKKCYYQTMLLIQMKAY